MKLAIGAMAFGPRVQLNLDLIRHAEKLGFDSAWTAEAYGNHAVTTATWIATKTETINVGTAIMQIPARTPAMAAMTATTRNALVSRKRPSRFRTCSCPARGPRRSRRCRTRSSMQPEALELVATELL